MKLAHNRICASRTTLHHKWFWLALICPCPFLDLTARTHTYRVSTRVRENCRLNYMNTTQSLTKKWRWWYSATAQQNCACGSAIAHILSQFFGFVYHFQHESSMNVEWNGQKTNNKMIFCFVSFRFVCFLFAAISTTLWRREITRIFIKLKTISIW